MLLRDKKAELPDLGQRLLSARLQKGLSQAELAARCQIEQAHVSYFEQGKRVPTLAQLLRLAKALDLSLQWFLSGSNRPGTSPRELAVELRHLGIVDLWVEDAPVPGAFRPPEEVVALVVAQEAPDPRLLEALPAVLAWNAWEVRLLKAYARQAGARTVYRLAWLAEVALLIDKAGGFPGGCRSSDLKRLVSRVKPPTGRTWDGLGRPGSKPPTSAVWKRWRINYATDLATFRQRAEQLHALRTARGKGGTDGAE